MSQVTELEALEAAIRIAASAAGIALLLSWTAASFLARPGSKPSDAPGRIRVTVRRSPRSTSGRWIPLLGLGLALAFPAGAKASRPPFRDAAPAQQPWQPVDGDPPPPPPAGAEVQPDPDGLASPPWSERAHPAVHSAIPSSKQGSVIPLFPRELGTPGERGNVGGEVPGSFPTSVSDHTEPELDPADVMLAPKEPNSVQEPPRTSSPPSACSGASAQDDSSAEKLACMRRHPAGKGIVRADDDGRSPTGRFHRVRPGESLWSIAATILETEDQARIARYWPRIHRANRDVIHDPNLIYAGQRLVLPPEPKR